uniref:SAM domain-containing protein n=1 Tax=Macrostomum lignano TaxID=282301 RepID=A0A1I8HK03_9PLAT
MSAATATLADIQSDFDWDAYLRSLGPKAARVAPASCFKQAANPPSNDFQPGQRLESRDPRNPDNTCIATVVECLGPRLRLRLDGSDDRNDFYRLTTSSPHPTSRFLVPPLGFAKSSNYWPAFLEKVKQTGNFAPRSSFRKPPPAPVKNTFSAGQKLEAVDRKNPLFVCPATVKEVRGDRVHVAFDGWRGAFDYWCRFDSHDLFPVGWCGRAGYPVQPPGSKDAARLPKPPPHRRASAVEFVLVHFNTRRRFRRQAVQEKEEKEKQKRQRRQRQDGGGGPTAWRQKLEDENPRLSKKSSATSAMAAATSTAAASGQGKERAADCLRISGCAGYRGAVLGPGAAPPSPPSSGSADSPAERAPAAHEQGGLRSTSGRCAPKFGHRRHSRALPRVADGREFWRLIGAFLAGLDSEGLFARRPGKLVGPADSSVADDLPTTNAELPVDEIDDEDDDEEVDEGDDGEGGEAEPQDGEAMPDSSQADASAGSAASRSIGVGVENDDDPPPPPSDMSEWTSGHVCQFLRQSESNLSHLAPVFHEHDIDGKALLLLSSDMMMKYMGVKLGPALKLLNCVEKAKRRLNAEKSAAEIQ